MKSSSAATLVRHIDLQALIEAQKQCTPISMYDHTDLRRLDGSAHLVRISKH